MGYCNCSMFCCALLCVHSSFAIISMGKREHVTLLCLCSLCVVIVVWLFLTMTWVCLQFVIVVFPDHTRLLFLSPILNLYKTYLTNIRDKKIILMILMFMDVTRLNDTIDLNGTLV